LKFRRQAPMGSFIADFVCHQFKLVIEGDGGQHGDEKDAKRDQWFQSAGYRVFRVWNNDVLKNPNGVLEAILSAASADKARTPHPASLREATLSLKGRG
jgi:very-short-patch-repair endonuclease